MGGIRSGLKPDPSTPTPTHPPHSQVGQSRLRCEVTHATGVNHMATASDRLLTVKEVMALLGISKVTLYRRINDGTIPAGVRLGPRAVRWKESTIADLIEGLPVNGRGDA